MMMSVQFSSFNLPPGGRLFVYDAQRTRYLGGFTEENEQPGGDFATALLPGEAVVVEYQEPAAAAHANVRISGITHAWMSPFPQGNDVQRDIYPGYPSSPCHTNVACPVAEGWQEQNRSVVMFVRPSGEGCNGVLLNNSQQDGTPYLLIANHCYQTNESQWIFYFNYRVGALIVGSAGRTMSDFAIREGPWWETVKAWWQVLVDVFWQCWLGSLIVATILGTATYFLSCWLVTVYRARHRRQFPGSRFDAQGRPVAGQAPNPQQAEGSPPAARS